MLLEQHALETEQLAAAGRRKRAAVDALLKEAMATEKLVRQHDRTVGELESLGERRLHRAAAVLRDSVGELAAPSIKLGLSEYGKQVFTKVCEVLKLYPGNLMQARLTRGQNGLGESFQAKDHVTEAFTDQVLSRQGADGNGGKLGVRCSWYLCRAHFRLHHCTDERSWRCVRQ